MTQSFGGAHVVAEADPTAIAQARAESMVIEYQVKLARYLRRMVGDSEVALDLSQEVFLSAYRMLQDGRGTPREELFRSGHDDHAEYG